jgi:hypothetical protein
MTQLQLHGILRQSRVEPLSTTQSLDATRPRRNATVRGKGGKGGRSPGPR